MFRPFPARLTDGIAIPALLATGILLAILASPPGSPLPGTSDSGRFSAERALQHVNVLAAQPRPIGSASHQAAREHIRSEMESLGLRVEDQATTTSYLRASRPGVSRFAYVRNIIGVLPGRDRSADALLLMAHYDSRALTPGAGDDASGTATLLETARALATGTKPRNDVIFLFTDGEESGLFGAQAFFRDHPLAGRIGAVLNFEARGSAGPVLMFQSSPDNGGLMNIFAEHSIQPAGNSLADAIYRRMRNDTDFSIPLEHDLQGLNFAFIDGFFDYHSPTDTPENLSRRSLQHAGNHALPLARELADRELPVQSGDDVTFFNLLGSHGFVSYPMWLDSIVLFAGLVFLAAIVLRSWRRENVTVTGLLRGATAALLLVVFPAMVVAAAFGAFIDLDADDALRGILARDLSWFTTWCLLGIGAFLWLAGQLPRKINGARAALFAVILLLGFHAAGLSLVTGSIAAIAAGLLLATGIGGRIKPLEQRLGTLFAWSLLGSGMLVLEPAGTYLFGWPLLLATVVVGLSAANDRETPAYYRAAIALPVITTFGFIIYFVNLALGYTAPLFTVIPLLLLALWLTVVIPERSPAESNWGLAMVVTGLVLAPLLAMSAPFNERYPRPTELFVIEDSVAGERLLGSGDEHLTTWQESLLGMSRHREAPSHWITRERSMHLQRLAGRPSSGLLVSPGSVESSPEGRTVELNLAGRGEVARGLLRIKDADSVRSIRVDGEPLARPPLEAGEDWTIYWVGMPKSGFALQLKVEDRQPITLETTSFSDDLPDAMLPLERPGDEMAAPYSWSDSTVFVERFVIP